jgi:uncharacterized membrane protein
VDVAVTDRGRRFARPIAPAVRVRAHHAVWAATAVSACVWATLAALRDSLFIDKRYDVGNFTQALWMTFHGHFMQVTEVGGAEVSRFGIHIDPILLAFAPLWWLWPSPMALLIVQAIAVALGAIPLFWLGRKYLPRDRDAALVAIAYLLCPTVTWNVISDFHTVALAVPLLLFAIWYLDEDRLVPFALTAGAATLCQEQVGLLVGCLGLWYAWQRRRFSEGLVIALSGFAVSAVDFLVVLRHFSGGSPYASRFGGSPSQLVLDLFTHPLRLVEQLNPHDLIGLLVVFPVLGLCFGSSLMLAAAPQIGLLLLSRRANDWGWFGINVLLLIPFIYASTALALGRWANKTRRVEPIFVSAHVFAASLALAIIVGPFGVFTNALDQQSPLSPQREAVSLVPAGARVSATDHLALPLVTRRYIYVFPVIRDAQWVLVDVRDSDDLPNMSFIRHRSGIAVNVSDFEPQPKLMRRELRRLTHSSVWRLVYRRSGIYAFKRRDSVANAGGRP